jgi:hypothetical protein
LRAGEICTLIGPNADRGGDAATGLGAHFGVDIGIEMAREEVAQVAPLIELMEPHLTLHRAGRGDVEWDALPRHCRST